MSYTNLLYHIVYATKERAPLITRTLRPRLTNISAAQFAVWAASLWKSTERAIMFTFSQSYGRPSLFRNF